VHKKEEQGDGEDDHDDAGHQSHPQLVVHHVSLVEGVVQADEVATGRTQAERLAVLKTMKLSENLN